MSVKRAFLAAMATVGLLFGVIAPTSGAQDGGDPPPPPLAGTTTLVTAGTFSAVAYLQIEFPNGIATCTGTLIDPMWVLTAAHCVQDSDNQGDPLHADEIQVMIGGTNANTEFPNPPNGVEVHTVIGWIIHGDFVATNFGISNDVALLKLPTPSAIDPITLATDESLVEPNNGSPLPARAFGFGQCGESSGACNDRRLRMGDSDIHSDADVTNGVAISGVNFGFNSTVRATNLFMAPDVTEDGAICPGDSGGPLMVQQSGEWRVAGVNSFIALNTSGAGNCVGTVNNQYLNAVADVVGSDLASYVNQVIDPPGEVCWGRTPTIEGTSFPDTIIGGPLADVIHGRGGRDFIWGRASGDRLCGGPSGDEIYGSTGKDRIKGNSGNDYLDGWTSADTIDGGDGDDTIFGWTGADKIDGEKGNDEINGEDGDDELIGGSGSDTIRGGDDDDTILGGSGHDRIFGNAGHDDIRGESGNDEISGGKAGDTIRGGGGDDEIEGKSGHDDIWGNSGNDALLGGTGRDDLNGGTGTDSCGGGPGADTKTGCESLP